MCALSVIGASSISPNMVPLSQRTGATSQSNPDAGGDVSTESGPTFKPITTADKAGASILTILAIALVVGGTAWIIV